MANLPQSFSEMRARIVRSLKHAFQAKGVVFLLSDAEYRLIDNSSAVSVGVDSRYLDEWERYYWQYDPFQQENRLSSNVCKVDDIIPYKRWVNLKIYNEFYLPQNIHYKLSIHLRSGAKVLGLIGLLRPKNHQDFTQRDMAKARILAPHLARALENQPVFSSKDGAKNLFEKWGDNLPPFGFVILDYEFRPIYWNSEAKEFCFLLSRKQLPQAGETDFEKSPIPYELLLDCLELKILFQNGHQPASLNSERMIDLGQNKRFKIISSLVEQSFQEAHLPGFVIYVLDSSKTYKGREETLREKYQLTNREIDIVKCVSQGLTNSEIADQLFISRFTVETHLKNIFCKTGVKHRARLTSLL